MTSSNNLIRREISQVCLKIGNIQSRNIKIRIKQHRKLFINKELSVMLIDWIIQS